MDRRRIFEWGGIAAAVVLVAFGVAAIVLGVQGKNTVTSSLTEQKIVGSDDMTPEAIRAEAQKAGLPESIDLPTCNVAGLEVNSGARARCFADYMRIHAYEATGGKTYAEMARDDPNRELWVTETALATALNVSYMADQLGNFGIVVGVALLLAGIGFAVLALGGALRRGP
jgi:hypothetical protein